MAQLTKEYLVNTDNLLKFIMPQMAKLEALQEVMFSQGMISDSTLTTAVMTKYYQTIIELLTSINENITEATNENPSNPLLSDDIYLTVIAELSFLSRRIQLNLQQFVGIINTITDES